jgi:putative redox protein
MVTMKAIYQGQKHCELTHGPSGSKIETDAPKDNQGKGERFSPTDLVGAVAERDGLSLEGATAEVEKHMVPDPRRIGALPLRITMPASLTAEQRKKLENTANHCPVHKSLHPDLKAEITFTYV